MGLGGPGTAQRRYANSVCFADHGGHKAESLDPMAKYETMTMSDPTDEIGYLKKRHRKKNRRRRQQPQSKTEDQVRKKREKVARSNQGRQSALRRRAEQTRVSQLRLDALDYASVEAEYEFMHDEKMHPGNWDPPWDPEDPMETEHGWLNTPMGEREKREQRREARHECLNRQRAAEEMEGDSRWYWVGFRVMRLR